MNTPLNRVANAEALLSVFGYWPSFHDAEVLDLQLDRSGSGLGRPSALISIHVFEMTDEVSPDGYFLSRKHSIVTLQCDDIDELELKWFNHQNALSELVVEEVEPNARLVVALNGEYGLEASFTCGAVSVRSVKAGVPAGSVYAEQKA